ncbi:MAG TPA: enoyl-CoA hydratase [Dehalococcoidia bacterium]|nr:enoyl-CoA hydratase [Dehalococcoidia bacterium]
MTTASEPVLLETAERVAIVTLNRPEKLNAFDYEMAEKLLTALEQAAADPQVRCVVLTGAGRGFCAGGDISAMAAGGAALGGEAMDPIARLRHEEEVSRLLHEMPKPTVAMVNGAAAGAGLSIALACDIRIAAESARFGTAFARVGFSGDFGGTWMLQRLVGPAKARELYFTADLIDAREAERIGLVNRTVPDDRLRQETIALAKKIADGPPIALARMKQNLNLGLTSDFGALLDAEAEGQIMTGLTQDHQNAVRAFLEKRPPLFEGR